MNPRFSWPLGEGVKAVIEFHGPRAVTKVHLERLQRYLDLYKEAIEKVDEEEEAL